MQEPLKDGSEDWEIIARVHGGDPDAFEAIVHRYASLVFRIVSRHVPGDQAQDVAQEAFLEAFRSLGSYSRKAPFSHWLSRIALRSCYRYWRSRRRGAEATVSDLAEEAREWMDRVSAADSRQAFEAECARQEAAEVLAHAMRELSPKDRMVLTLVHLEGYSVQEAADLLGWTVISVKVRAHRSRTKMRQAILKLLETGRRGR